MYLLPTYLLLPILFYFIYCIPIIYTECSTTQNWLTKYASRFPNCEKLRKYIKIPIQVFLENNFPSL